MTTLLDIVKNKGYGAGGSNTNYYGKKFEEKTSNFKNLLLNGYTKKSFKSKPKKEHDYYLCKKFDDKVITYVSQIAFKKYMKIKYDIDMFRYPDEAYIIEYNQGKHYIKILEKKNQNVEGSIENKLWCGPSFKREYELVLGSKFNVEYAFCVSKFLKDKIISHNTKYVVLNTILKESDIIVLYGDDKNYFKLLELWFNNSLQ